MANLSTPGSGSEQRPPRSKRAGVFDVLNRPKSSGDTAEGNVRVYDRPERATPWMMYGLFALLILIALVVFYNFFD